MWEKQITPEELYQRENHLKKEDILALREWMNKQSHLPSISEVLLIFFLHACHYKIEPTKVCLENFCTLRSHWPEFAQNRDIFSKENQEALQTMLAAPLPVRTKSGNLVIYIRLMDANADHYNLMAGMRLVDMIIWMWYLYLGTNPGQMILIDMEGFSLAHLMKLNLVQIKKYLYYIQEALAVRLKAIHIISVSPMTDKLLAMVKPLMKKELMDLIYAHPKNDTLFAYVPKEALPKEYGGEAGTFKELHDEQIRMAEENAQVFLDTEKIIADESKRQGKPKNLNDIFGVEGTFRTLDID